MAHNPTLSISEKNIQTEKYGIDDGTGGEVAEGRLWNRRYPVSIPHAAHTDRHPASDNEPGSARLRTDHLRRGRFFRLPLYRGGRITRNIRIAETRKAVAEENYAANRQDLIYNLTSVYHKILQLQKLLVSTQASVTQLESHERDVSEFLRVGTVPRLDLLKTEVELAHARQNVLAVRNNLDSAFELLKNLMGIDDMSGPLSIADEPVSGAALSFPR